MKKNQNPKKMKQLIFRSFIVLLIFSLGSGNTFASTTLPSAVTQTAIKKEFTKTIKKEFDIDADGKVSIVNKYGEVNINTWDQNKVKIVPSHHPI